MEIYDSFMPGDVVSARVVRDKPPVFPSPPLPPPPARPSCVCFVPSLPPPPVLCRPYIHRRAPLPAEPLGATLATAASQRISICALDHKNRGESGSPREPVHTSHTDCVHGLAHTLPAAAVAWRRERVLPDHRCRQRVRSHLGHLRDFGGEDGEEHAPALSPLHPLLHTGVPPPGRRQPTEMGFRRR